jgi:hypothetical protein
MKAVYAGMLGAAMLAAAHASAEAATVKYSTSGVFATSGTSSLTIGNTTLSFSGNPLFETPFTGLQGADFGSFTLTSTTASPYLDVFTNESFTLTLTHSIPLAASSGGSTATFSGFVSTTPGSNVITMNFTPNPFVVDGIVYELPSVFSISIPSGYVAGTNVTKSLTGSLDVPPGTPNIVPLPPAAIAGAGLMGLMAFRRARAAKAKA